MKKLIQSCPSNHLQFFRDALRNSTRRWLNAKRALFLDPFNQKLKEDVDFWSQSRKEWSMGVNHWRSIISRNACLCRIHIRKAP